MRPTKFAPLLAALAAFVLSASCATAAPTSPGIVSAHGRLRAEKSRIVGEDGKPVSLAGVSFGWSQWEAARFYNAGVVNWLKQDWHAGIVRAALGIDPTGYISQPEENKARVTAVIDAAIAADLYVLIDWHDHHAHQRPELAVAFFAEMARRYGDKPNVIYEIFNEPMHDVTWLKDVKPYAERVIAAIRAIDPDNLIVVGTTTYSQDVDIATADPIKDPNIAYSLHFYAGTHKKDLRDKALVALNRGFALFVTEWGTCRADGDGGVDATSVQEWMVFLREHQLSHCNWAVYDKHETAAINTPTASSTGNWTDADLSPSGRYARELIRNWTAQPKK